MTYPLFFSTLYLVGGLIIFLMGLVIFRESPRSAVNRATAFMLFSSALGTMLGALGRLASDPTATGTVVAYASFLRNFSYLWEFFFPSLLYFALVYPHRLVVERNLHGIEAALYVPYFAHLALVLFFGEQANVAKPFDPLLRRFGTGTGGDLIGVVVDVLVVLVTIVNRVHAQLFSLVNVAYASLAIYLLARSRRQSRSARVRGPLGIVLVGLTLCVLCYSAAKLLPVFFPFQQPGGAFDAVLTSLALLVASGAIAWAIVRYKFLDIRNLTQRSILYGAAAVLFALVYMVVLRQVTRYASTVFGGNVAIIETGLLVFSLIVFQPLLVGLEDLLEGFARRGGRADPQRIVQDLARQMAAEVDLPGMRARIATSLRQGLLVDEARLVIVDEATSGWRFDDGETVDTVTAESPEGALVRFFEASPEPALMSDVLRSLEPLPGEPERLLLWVRDCRLLVPIVQQSRLRGVLGVGSKITGGRFHAEDVGLLALLGQQVATSLENLRLLSENLAKRLLEEEIQLASQIQKGLLPTRFPDRPGYAVHGMSLASKEVGGDYFDVFSTDGRRLHLAIADVSGKGVPAAMLMSWLRAALRSNVEHLHSPGRVLERINHLLYESTSPEKFATFFYGTLDTESHMLVYANAGHNYPIVVRADGSATELSEGGLVLGVFPEARYTDGAIPLGLGETLFLYTDGITEATNHEDEEFGPERLMGFLGRVRGTPPERVVSRVLETVREFSPGPDIADDMTMVVVCRNGEGT